MKMNKAQTKMVYTLLGTLTVGPSLRGKMDVQGYNLWVSTWVIPTLRVLIPGLDEVLEYNALSSETQTVIIHGYTCIPKSCPRCTPSVKPTPVSPAKPETITLEAQTITVHGTPYCGRELTPVDRAIALYIPRGESFGLDNHKGVQFRIDRSASGFDDYGKVMLQLERLDVFGKWTRYGKVEATELHLYAFPLSDKERETYGK